MLRRPPRGLSLIIVLRCVKRKKKEFWFLNLIWISVIFLELECLEEISSW